MTSTTDHAVEASTHASADPLVVARAKIANLEVALASSRTIGVAMGIIVERCKISADEAFNVLVRISQHDHRKLRDVAAELVFTGAIPRH